MNVELILQLETELLIKIAPPWKAVLPLNSPLNTTFSMLSKKLIPAPYDALLLMKLLLNTIPCRACL